MRLPESLEEIKEIATGPKFRLDVSKYRDGHFRAALEYIIKNERSNPRRAVEFVYTKEVKAAPRPRKGMYGWYNPASKNRKEIQSFLKDVFRKEFGRKAGLVGGASRITIRLYKPIPKSFTMVQKLLAEMGYLEPEHAPDVDNYSKSIMDAMIGTVVSDDDIMTKLTIQKLYSAAPRVEVKFLYRALPMLPSDGKKRKKTK